MATWPPPDRPPTPNTRPAPSPTTPSRESNFVVFHHAQPSADAARALTAVATTLATAGQTADAHRLAIDAERVARIITDDDYGQAEALTAVAAAGQTADARRICVECLLTDNWASIAPTLVSLSTNRNVDTGFTQRLVSGLVGLQT